MTREELKKLFSMTHDSKLRLGELQNGKRIHAIENIQTSFVNAATEMILNAENNGADVQRRLLNHLWKAYVIAMACQGIHVISFEKMLADVKIPKAVGKPNVEVPNDADHGDTKTA